MRFRFAVCCFAIASVCLAGKIARTNAVAAEFHAVPCEGTYPHHLQGICTNERDAIYWSFTTTLVKTDRRGKVLKKIPVASHHGDLCFDDGKIYVAVNLGKFNDPAGRADSWVYVYDAGDLSFLKKHEIQQVFHGAGGIGIRNGQFFVVGGLPEGVDENYVYQYDQDFRFVKKHVINSGYTLMGIQTATFADGYWWFGCYGKPQFMLKTDESFQLLGKYEFDCSLGIVGLSVGRFLVARGRYHVGQGCSGRVMLAHSEPDKGLVVNDEITITVFEPPGKDLRPSIGPGRPVLISGRFLTPAGRTALAQSYSWGMAISADESTAVLLSRGAFQVISTAEPKVVDRFPAFGQKAPQWLEDGAYMGCALSPDSQKLYLGSANHGEIVVYDLKSRVAVDRININGDGYQDSFLGDFLLSADGRLLYGVDQFNYRMVVVDLGQRCVVRSVRVGRNPFGICLSPDAKYAWVSNVGMFEYPLLPGVTPQSGPTAGLSFPAYGVPSKESEEGVVAEGKKIPGLGSPNHPDAMSVFKVELMTGRVEAKIKTGYLVGQRRGDINTVGGASPSTVVAGQRFAYVSNATNDTISVIDVRRNAIVDQIELLVPGLETLRGVLPFSIALSPDEQSLYVACAGLNAVAVVDLERRRLAGYIPAGWFCSLVHVSRDGQRLFVSSSKGIGSAPNGGRGFVAPARGSHPGDIMQGLFQVIDVPDAARLAEYTRQVVANTYQKRQLTDDGRNPLPPAPRLRPSPVRHIVFIVKENRTFDQVFGERKNVAGDPTLAGLGCHVTVVNKAGAKVEDVNVSPNHQALADRFALCDNFYCDSDQSNTGHRWVVGVYPNEWVEVNARSRIEARLFSSAPGRRYVAGAAAGIFPEDYNEAGALWEHLDRHRVPFFNFGFGTEMPASIEEQIHKYTGMQMRVSIPLPKPLFDNTSRKFATFNMHIPDQFRVDMFEEEYREKWASGRESFPRLVTMVLPNDHLTDESPSTGYPFKESYMADNDLALARVVRFLSRTPYWKNMLIIVTEDDPQGGRDHVDAHRSLLMLISPYVKKGWVSSTLLDFGSIMKMIFTLLDLPSLNQFDATAAMPSDCFSDEPDFTPYTPQPVDPRLFDPAKALKPFERGFDWSRLLDSPAMDDPEDMRSGFEQEDRRSETRPLPGVAPLFLRPTGARGAEK